MSTRLGLCIDNRIKSPWNRSFQPIAWQWYW